MLNAFKDVFDGIGTLPGTLPDGIVINETTVEAVKTMKAPKDKATLQSFLGLVKYMKKFSQNFSHRLRELVKQHTIFQWESHHDDAFKAVKDELSRTPTLRFFDPSKNYIIQTDVSFMGLGAVLIQEERPPFTHLAVYPQQKSGIQTENENFMAWCLASRECTT